MLKGPLRASICAQITREPVIEQKKFIVKIVMAILLGERIWKQRF